MTKTRSFHDWLYNPTDEESICANPFHLTCKKVFDGYSPYSALDPYTPEEDAVYTKLAKLLKAELIILEGTAIYVREGETLHLLGDAIPLLAYYMHTDTREAQRAAAILESNFMGYFPVTQSKTWKGGICLVDKAGSRRFVNLYTLEEEDPEGYPEFGTHAVEEDRFLPLVEFFSAINEAVDDPFFHERALMYPLLRPFREKSFVLVGGGGNGKSLFMSMVQRLFGSTALVDAPQPTFRGHDPAVISYGFIGKRVVTFNDVGDPSTAFLEWLKRMITGNLEVKTPSGAWLSVPCDTGFLLETNHRPQILDLPAHKRRYIVRTFREGFLLKDKMDDASLDVIGDRGSVNAGDIVNYLLHVKDAIEDWTTFKQVELPQPESLDF